jgi:hypothetical protein
MWNAATSLRFEQSHEAIATECILLERKRLKLLIIQELNHFGATSTLLWKNMSFIMLHHFGIHKASL